MFNLSELTEQVATAFKSRAIRFAAASRFAKFLFAFLTAMSAVAQFTGGEALSWSSFVGISSAASAAIIAIFLVFTENDASSELEIARQATAFAKQKENEFEDAVLELRSFNYRAVEQVRAGELYQAMNAMRGVIERIAGEPKIDEVRAVELLIEVAKRSLTIALGYQLAEHHTLCVYKAETDPQTHKVSLRLIAHSRTVDCPIRDARLWPLGVGVGGTSYARGVEVVVPDMTAVEIGSLYRDLSKDEDVERYKSIASVPVLVFPHAEPWGVVIGTSDRPSHFSVGVGSDGVQTVEAIRALAGMVALAVRVTEVSTRLGATEVVATA